MRRSSIVTFTVVLGVFVGCGSAGDGGQPIASYASSDAPPSANGAAAPAGKQGGAGDLPGRVEPGSGSGLGSGTTTGGAADCKAVCDLVAACGGDTKNCAKVCPALPSDCIACLASASCSSAGDCDSACSTPSSTGAGGTSSSQGAGGSSHGQGAGGSSTTSFTCHDLTACCGSATFPMAAVAGCNNVASSGQDKVCSSAYQGYRSAGYCPLAAYIVCVRGFASKRRAASLTSCGCSSRPRAR